MPAKGSNLKNGKRHNIVDKAFYRQFKRETGIEITYTEFVLIINTSNKAIQDKVINNISGFKLPESMGYLAVTRYKPKTGTRSIDWNKTKQTGSLCYHTNFHSNGYRPRILWLTDRLSSCRFISTYKFQSDRALSRGVSKQVFEGKIYNEFTYDDFKFRKIKINLDKLK
jgi:hypothetical protein